MRVILSLTLMISLVTVSSRSTIEAQAPEEKSRPYQEAWETNDLNLRVAKLREVIQQTPKMLAAHYYLGLTLSQLKRYDEAIAAYQQLIKSSTPSNNPSDRFVLAAHYELGKTSLMLSDYKAAATEYQWLKEHGAKDGGADEMALFLSDLFPKHAAEHYQVPLLPLTGEKGNTAAAGEKQRSVAAMSPASRIVILHKEKARYTEIARLNKVQGSVLLSVVFTEEGKITDINVIRGLPDGLTRRAIEATLKVQFQPATKDGKAVSVRGSLEYTFQLF
jgi:TonB family protein